VPRAKSEGISWNQISRALYLPHELLGFAEGTTALRRGERLEGFIRRIKRSTRRCKALPVGGWAQAHAPLKKSAKDLGAGEAAMPGDGF
jgi:hypothetical protein